MLSEENTFKPDPGRMIRAIRFMNTKGFKLGSSLKEYIKMNGIKMVVTTILQKASQFGLGYEYKRIWSYKNDATIIVSLFEHGLLYNQMNQPDDTARRSRSHVTQYRISSAASHRRFSEKTPS